MRKILYIGIFDSINLGDLIISNYIYNFLTQELDCEVHCVDFINLTKINIKKGSISIYNAPYFDRKHNFIYTLNKYVRSMLSYSLVLQKIYINYREIIELFNKHYDNYTDMVADYDLICIGGGNLLMSVSNNLWGIRINKLIKTATLKNKKIFIMAVGAGPINSNKSRKLYSEALNDVDFITVRDVYSKYLLKNELNISNNVMVSGDPALLIENKIERKQFKKTGMNIAISIMPFGKRNFLNAGYHDTNYYKIIFKNLIEELYNRDSRYKFNLFSTDWSDYTFITDMYKYILRNSECITQKNIGIVYITNLDDLLDFYNKQDLLIGTRMHSLIIAFTQSVPIIALSWQDKIDGFMQYVGLSHNCYQLNDLETMMDTICENAQNIINTTINNNPQLSLLRDNFKNVNSLCLQAVILNSYRITYPIG